jgi:hypothetical protein
LPRRWAQRSLHQRRFQRWCSTDRWSNGRGRDGSSSKDLSRPPHRSQRAGLPHWALI